MSHKPNRLLRHGASALTVALASFVASSTASAGGDGRWRNGGELISVGGDGPLPLLMTDVDAQIVGATASVKIEQRFRNPNAKPLEAIYVYPLPDEAALTGLSIRVRDREIHAEIRKRANAASVYERAKLSGKVAALLDQERPNIFTQSVANIFPKSEVVVEISFDVPLEYRDGGYEFSFPLVVGPRFIPGDPNGRPTTGWGESPDTDRVPDASRVTPPITLPGTRSGRDVRVGVSIDIGGLVRELSSPTHGIRVVRTPKRGRDSLRVDLAQAAKIPNKDFVLRFRSAEKRPAIRVLSHKDAKAGGFFTLLFDPPRSPSERDIAAKDLFFVVDTSSSMAGVTMEQVRGALIQALGELRSGDRVQIVGVNSTLKRLSPTPINVSNGRARARKFIDGLGADSDDEATEIGPALAKVLGRSATSGDGSRVPVVCLITDGLYANESEVLEAIAKLRKRARIFTLGVGAAPNRFLLRRAAALGGGDAFFVLPGEPGSEQVSRFLAHIRRPVLSDVEIDWKGLDPYSVLPTRVPDLYVGQPLSIVGRYRKAGRKTIAVKAQLGGRPVEYSVPVEFVDVAAKGSVTAAQQALPRLWARTKIRSLELEAVRGMDRSVEITKLGLEYQLVTRHTSFVAVSNDDSLVPGELETTILSNDLPEGMETERRAPKTEARSFESDKRKTAKASPTEPAPAPPQSTERRPGVEADSKVDRDVVSTESTEVAGGGDAGDDDVDDAVASDTDHQGDEDDYSEDGNDDDDEDSGSDEDDEPQSDRVAAGSPASVRSESTAMSFSGSGGGLLDRWRFSIGLGLGLFGGANTGESGFAAAATLSLDRHIGGPIVAGISAQLLRRGSADDRTIGSLVFTLGVLRLLGPVDLIVGSGPTFASSGVGAALLGALRWRGPVTNVPLDLILRGDYYLRVEDADLTSATLGVEFSF